MPTTLNARIGRNLAHYRGDMSQRELANKVREYGPRWTHLTVASVEKGERPLRADEVVVLLDLLRIPSFKALIAREETTQLSSILESCKKALFGVRRESTFLIRAREALQGELDRTQAGQPDELLEEASRILLESNEMLAALEAGGQLPERV